VGAAVGVGVGAVVTVGAGAVVTVGAGAVVMVGAGAETGPNSLRELELVDERVVEVAAVG
jgi:hypothetical protein